MKKGYYPLIAGQLDAVLTAFQRIDFLLAIEYWLIQQLHIELKDKLAGVKIEVIKFGYYGAYPALAILYVDDNDSPDISAVVEATIDQLLHEKSLGELIAFLRTSGIDWDSEAKRIMGSGQ